MQSVHSFFNSIKQNGWSNRFNPVTIFEPVIVHISKQLRRGVYTIFPILFGVFIILYAFVIKLNWVSNEPIALGKMIRTIPTFILLWFLATPLIIWIKQWLYKGYSKFLQVLCHLLISIILATCIDLLSEILTFSIEYVAADEGIVDHYRGAFGKNIFLIHLPFVGMAIYGLILFILFSTDYYFRYKNEQIRRAQTERRLSEAELLALKMQLHPHFLFNTLNSISALMTRNTDEAQDVVGRLGDLLRYTLNHHEDFVSLKTEINFIKNYLEIEKSRYRERLQVIYNIDPQSLSVPILSFLLQPLVENAIKHGLSPSRGQCTIEIYTSMQDDQMYIVVRDNGRGSKDIKLGVGLSNIQKRLLNAYGKDYQFQFQNCISGGFEVIIYIPIGPKNGQYNNYKMRDY